MKNTIEQLQNRLQHLKEDYFGSYEELLDEFKQVAKRHPDWIVLSFKDKKNDIPLVDFLDKAHKFYLRDIVKKDIGKNYHISLTDALLHCIDELEKPLEKQKKIDLTKENFFDYLIQDSNYLPQLLDFSYLKNNVFLELLISNPLCLFTDYNNDILTNQMDFQNFLYKNQTVNSLTLNTLYTQNFKTIPLLYQIGRFLRNADIFNANKRIYLFAPDLMQYIQKEDKNRLPADFHYIQRLCKILNIDTDIIGVDMITIENQTYDLQLIKQKATVLAELADFLSKKITLTNDSIQDGLIALCRESDNRYNIPSYITFSKEDIQTIYQVYKQYNSLEINIFNYALTLQYLQQLSETHVEIADEKAYQIIENKTLDSNMTITHNTIYFKNYDLSKEILFDDFKFSVEQDKIANIINQLHFNQLAIQMSDLFSYCHYFFDKDDVFWVSFFKLLIDIDCEDCVTAWKEYQNNTHLLSDFKSKFLTIWYENTSLPYFIYPYMYALKAKKDMDFEEKFRKIFSKMIPYVLSQLDIKMKE